MTILILVVVVAATVSGIVANVLISRRLVVIHDLVNSNLTRVQADLKVAENRIAKLEAALADNSMS